IWSFFFFSSRRRHTRFSRDWSSDVCSSDLGLTLDQPHLSALSLERLVNLVTRDINLAGLVVVVTEHRESALIVRRTVNGGVHIEIGRASCRERGEIGVVCRSRSVED